jgi:hypothetical protein
VQGQGMLGSQPQGIQYGDPNAQYDSGVSGSGSGYGTGSGSGAPTTSKIWSTLTGRPYTPSSSTAGVGTGSGSYSGTGTGDSYSSTGTGTGTGSYSSSQRPYSSYGTNPNDSYLMSAEGAVAREGNRLTHGTI